MSNFLSMDDIQNILQSRDLTSIHKSLAEFPHFSLLADMEKATARIVKAICNDEVLYLVGDYDCDGVTATATIIEFFRDIGYPIEYIIPNRFTDGYGISPSVLNKIDYADVIFTVDNGIVAHEAALICKERNIDLIITDHHTVGDKLPDCFAVVNPKREDCAFPFKDICGVQVAFLLCASIKSALSLDLDMSKYLDLMAVGVVADVMPLKDLNWHIVRNGIKSINSLRRPFFQALLSEIGKLQFTYDDIGYVIAPRINAVGRIMDASIGVEALLSKDLMSAKNNVAQLTCINEERKSLQNEVYKHAKTLVKNQKDFVLVVGEKLHEGIVGIVASKLAEDTGYPCLVLSEVEGGIFKGSGRSVGSVDIYSLIKRCPHLLEKFGGHPGACGLSLKKENFEEFDTILKQYASELPKDMFIDSNSILGELKPSEIDLDLIGCVNDFAPFGEKNPHPLFFCKEALIKESKAMGQEKNHTSLTILWEDSEMRIAVFNTDSSEFLKNEKISFNYSLSINEWQGKKNPQIMPSSIKKVG